MLYMRRSCSVPYFLNAINEEGLSLRRRSKKKRTETLRGLMPAVTRPDEVSSIHLIWGALFHRRRQEISTIVDDFIRISPGIFACRSTPGEAVAEVIDQRNAVCGHPKRIRVDSGREFVGPILEQWITAWSITLEYKRPRKPTENACIQNFNRRFSNTYLSEHWLVNVPGAQAKIDTWHFSCNTERPLS